MPRATVEMSLTLDIRTFVRKGWWRPDTGMRGSSIWSFRGQETGRIGWTAYPDSLILSYATTDSRGERTARDDVIPILRETDRLGRDRVYFLCPGCAERVLTLHAPVHRGAIWFCCRTCHGLSYHSRQEYQPAFGKLFNRLLRLQERARRASIDEIESIYDQTDATNTALNKWFQRTGRATRQDPVATPPILPARPPGRPKTKRAYVRRQPLELRPPSSDCEAYCVRCRDRRPLKRARRVTLSNGRPALRGRCTVCETRLCRLLPSAQAEPALRTPVDRPGL